MKLPINRTTPLFLTVLFINLNLLSSETPPQITNPQIINRYTIPECCNLEVTIDNAHLLRDRPLIYEKHKIGGIIIKIVIDQLQNAELFLDKQKIESCRVYCNFFHIPQRYIAEDVPQDRRKEIQMPSDAIAISVNGDDYRKCSLSTIPEPLQTTIRELSTKAGAVLLYPNQASDEKYWMRKSSWTQSFEGPEGISQEPWKHFYTSALALIEYLYNKKLVIG